jgi:hypothetical protein
VRRARQPDDVDQQPLAGVADCRQPRGVEAAMRAASFGNGLFHDH